MIDVSPGIGTVAAHWGTRNRLVSAPGSVSWVSGNRDALAALHGLKMWPEVCRIGRQRPMLARGFIMSASQVHSQEWSDVLFCEVREAGGDRSLAPLGRGPGGGRTTFRTR